MTTALITGASRNIGAATARTLASNGHDVILVARNEERLRTVASSIVAATGRSATYVAVDLSDPTAVPALKRAVDQAPSPIEVLVNNAYGSAQLQPAMNPLDLDEDEWLAAFRLNVLVPHRLARLTFPQMRSLGRGSIINIVTSSEPIRGFAVAGSTKAALWALTRYLAIELAPIVRVNAVAPGTIAEHTGSDERAFDRSALLPGVPMSREGAPAEVAQAIAFLASQRSSYVTGALLAVTGGRTA